MTKEEFAIKKETLRKEFLRKRKELAAEYAKENSSVNIGDIVTDHIGSVKVDRILVDGLDNPCCVYYGVEYTKKGTPYKSGSRRGVFQTNITHKITPKIINHCDGCRRGLPLENGIHIGKGFNDLICCTKHLYT